MDTGVGPRSRITAVRSASKCLSVESADPPLRGLLGWCKGSLRRSLRAPDRQRPQSPERIALIGVLICGNTTLLKPWTRGWPGEPGELWLRVVDTPAGPELRAATGMISVQLDVSMDDAFVRLRATAFAEQRPLAELAADVVARRVRPSSSSVRS